MYPRAETYTTTVVIGIVLAYISIYMPHLV